MGHSAFDVKFFQPPNQMPFSGTITSANSGGRFQIVLFDEESFGSDEMGSSTSQAPLTFWSDKRFAFIRPEHRRAHLPI